MVSPWLIVLPLLPYFHACSRRPRLSCRLRLRMSGTAYPPGLLPAPISPCLVSIMAFLCWLRFDAGCRLGSLELDVVLVGRRQRFIRLMSVKDIPDRTDQYTFLGCYVNNTNDLRWSLIILRLPSRSIGVTEPQRNPGASGSPKWSTVLHADDRGTARPGKACNCLSWLLYGH